MIVSNSSSLISLAKINRLDLLKKLKKNVITPKIVYEETVVKGKEENYFDAVEIENRFKNRNIKDKDVESEWVKKIKQKVEKKLEEGDYHVLALTEKEKASEVLTDDVTLGSMALLLGFQPISTPDLLLEGLGKKLIDLNDYKTSMSLLVIEKRITPDVAEAYILRGEKIVGRRNEKG